MSVFRASDRKSTATRSDLAPDQADTAERPLPGPAHGHHRTVSTIPRIPALPYHRRPIHPLAGRHPHETSDRDHCTKAFINGWVQFFGVPERIITDQGRQFESRLFNDLNALLGTRHLRTTAYRPQANGLVERFHRTLKSSIKCLTETDWSSALPMALLELRATLKEDINATAAEMVYGQNLQLPALSSTPPNHQLKPSWSRTCDTTVNSCDPPRQRITTDHESSYPSHSPNVTGYSFAPTHNDARSSNRTRVHFK